MATALKLIIFSVMILFVCSSQPETEREHLASFTAYETGFAKDFFQSLMAKSLIHEFSSKTKIPPNTVDCYFELCKNGSELNCGIEVVSPGSLIQSYIALTNRTILAETEKPVKESNLQIICPLNAIYACCLDNSGDRYTTKMVNYQVSVINHQDVSRFHFHQHSKEENDTTIGTYKLYDHLYQVASDTVLASRHLSQSTSTIARDWATLSSNVFRIKMTSVIAIAMTCFVGFAQVYTVKRMFRDNSVLIGGRG